MLKRTLLFIAIFAVLCSPSVFATDLMDIYKQAIHCDPTYQNAWSTMLANQENLPQAVSNLLPNISATADTTGNYLKVVNEAGVTELGTAELGTTGVSPLGTFRYNTNNYTISLTQPVFNFSNYMLVKQNQYVYKQAASTFSAAIQDLIIRVAQAYLNVLQAQDNLIYTEAQKLANARELDQTKQRYNVGLDAITSVYNAQAAYDSIVAQEIAARNTLHNNLEALRQLTGCYYPCIEGLKIQMPLIEPCPVDVEKWVCAAERNNQTLMAARFNADAARAAIKVFFGGHLPNVNVVSTYGRSSQQFSTFYQGTVGLQLNVPIFQGGFVSSQVRQAQDNYATAVAQMADAHRKITITARQSYNNVYSGISKVQADRAAILSAQSSLQSTQESFRVGTRTIIDVLIAQQQLYQARTNYAADEYAYLLSTLQLKQAAGTLSPCDLMQINAWLHGPDRRNLGEYLQGPGIESGTTTPIIDTNGPVTPTTGISITPPTGTDTTPPTTPSSTTTPTDSGTPKGIPYNNTPNNIPAKSTVGTPVTPSTETLPVITPAPQSPPITPSVPNQENQLRRPIPMTQMQEKPQRVARNERNDICGIFVKPYEPIQTR